jgi:hypothetical protein
VAGCSWASSHGDFNLEFFKPYSWQRSVKLHDLSDGLNYLAKLDSEVVNSSAVISLVGLTN